MNNLRGAALLFVLVSGVAQAQGVGKIKKIDFIPNSDGGEFRVDYEGDATFKAYQVENQKRLVLEAANLELPASLTRVIDLSAKNGAVVQVTPYNTTAGNGRTSAKFVLQLRKVVEKFPQIVVSVKVKQKPAWEKLPDVLALVKEAETKLGKEGRVFLRYSGTEPKARLLIEGRDGKQIKALADKIAGRIKEQIG